MPVSKKTGSTRSTRASSSAPTLPPLPPPMPEHHETGCMCCRCMGMKKKEDGFGRKILLTLVSVLLVYAIFWLGTLIRNNLESYNFIGKADRQERTITVEGEDKVTATPDIAMTTIGMVADGQTVAEAQQTNTTVMNALISKLQDLGVASDDIQTTNYNIYPQYNYTSDEGRVLEGYEVSQNVTIKIRDLTKANQVIALAGDVGANTVSGLQFTIDDREVYRQEARAAALQKVYEKAQALSQSLGVRLVSVVSYNEYDANDINPYASYASYDTSYGVGGAAAPAPDIQTGTMDVDMHVSVTFEIR